MAVLTYSLLRIVLIVGAGAILYVLGVRSWLLVALAVLIGAGLSYVLLHKQRLAAAGTLRDRSDARGTKFEQSVSKDDDDEDAQISPDRPVTLTEEGAASTQDEGSAEQHTESKD